jgi:hypothetical protein
MRKKMKKNLLTLMFVVTFLCFGATFASAKNSSPTKNSVNVSAKAVSTKIKALTAKCKFDECGYELSVLVGANDLYEYYCAAGGYQGSCQSQLASRLIQLGNEYVACLNGNQAKNTDRTMDRNKIEKSQV